MEFLTNNFILFFIALIIGVIFYFSLSYISSSLNIEELVNRSKMFKIILIAVALLFVVILYFTKPMYYFPNNEGIIGDNYSMMDFALEKRGSLKD